MSRRVARAMPLPDVVATSLRERVGQEWHAGDPLPTEAELAADYGVSRHTVRQALLKLQRAGVVETRHGLGTFVTRYTASISAGLQELRSLHELITKQGRRAESVHHVFRRRPATAEEAEQLERAEGTEVVDLRRSILADGRTVAFDYSVIVGDALPADLDQVTGSMFDHYATGGVLPERAVARVRAVIDPSIGWGEGRSPQGLYLLLDQVQYLPGGRPLSLSKIYFLDDGFDFLIVRHAE
ncbi:GntR family transcriptional regulator [Actinoplanes sp. NPDC051851]|uniref:GntR family transcriptional regulator n=1 Tax=Actinoplanes sp. NPDC051851 TaxID=3154753 RepID=UPI0034313730